MLINKCYGESCIFIHKCRNVETIFDWLSLCDIISNSLKEEYAKRLSHYLTPSQKISVKIQVASEVLESFCKKVNHQNPELLVANMINLYSIYTQVDKTFNNLQFGKSLIRTTNIS